MAPSLALSGVFSGIDTDVLIAAAMGYARAPLTKLELQKAVWQAKDSAVADLESRLTNFKSIVDSLRSESSLKQMTARSEDTDYLAAVASDGAIEGVHSIEIGQVAQNYRAVHTAGFAPTEAWTHSRNVATADTEYISADDITAGTDYQFIFQFGDESQVTVDLSGYDAGGITLNELVTEINTAAGYTAASAVSIGGVFNLRIQAQDVGPGKDLTITDDNSVDLLDNTDDFSQTVDGDVGTDSILGAGQFVYTYDGVTRTITTTESSNLGNLRDLINNDGLNPGVNASIIRYDSTYHLILSGEDSGSDYSVTINDASTTLPFDTADFTITQVAQDSQIKVDGFPPGAGDWIERSSNNITDVIANVKLEIRKVTESPINLNIIRSTGQLRSDLENLVAVYNGLVDKIASYAGFDEDTGAGGLLQGDTSMTRLLDPLRSAITSAVPGFDSSTDSFTFAIEVGLEFGVRDSEGLTDFDEIMHLNIDTSVLDSALSQDYKDVAKLIGGYGSGVSDIDDIQFAGSSSFTEGGIYDVRVDFDATGIVTLAMIRKQGESVWRNLKKSEGQLVGELDNPESGLSLTPVWDTSGAYTANATVRVHEGFAQVLYDRLDDMLDDVTGRLVIKRDQYELAIKTIDRNIERQERLLEIKRKYLEKKYVRMEVALAKLDLQRGAVDAMVIMFESILKTRE